MKHQQGKAISIKEKVQANNSPMLYGDWERDWSPKDLDRRLNGGFPIVFKAGGGLTAPERIKLTTMIEMATYDLCVMPREEEIISLLSLMFNVMKNGNASNDPEIVAVVYRMVVDGIPSLILYQAVKNITTGRAEGLSEIFFPTTAQFRRYCEKLEKQVRACIESARRLLDAPEVAPQKRIDGERLALLLGCGHEAISQTRH